MAKWSSVIDLSLLNSVFEAALPAVEQIDESKSNESALPSLSDIKALPSKQFWLWPKGWGQFEHGGSTWLAGFRAKTWFDGKAKCLMNELKLVIPNNDFLWVESELLKLPKVSQVHYSRKRYGKDDPAWLSAPLLLDKLPSVVQFIKEWSGREQFEAFIQCSIEVQGIEIEVRFEDNVVLVVEFELGIPQRPWDPALAQKY